MDPERKCYHNLAATIYTSKKQLGRQFYRCPKPIGDEQCDYFLWLDEAVSSPSQDRVLPRTPLSAQASGAILDGPPSTPTPQSRKRNASDDLLSSATLSWSSQKRVKYAEADEKHPGRHSSRVADEGPSLSQETARSEGPEDLSADIVAIKLQSLSEIPEYIRKLERRKLAAERSRDAKAQKIANLEAEVERLKKREKELEELVALLESAQE